MEQNNSANTYLAFFSNELQIQQMIANVLTLGHFRKMFSFVLILVNGTHQLNNPILQFDYLHQNLFP